MVAATYIVTSGGHRRLIPVDLDREIVVECGECGQVNRWLPDTESTAEAIARQKGRQFRPAADEPGATLRLAVPA